MEPVRAIVSPKETAPVLAKLEVLRQAQLPPTMSYPMILLAMEPLLRLHRTELIQAVAVMTGQTVEAIEAQPFAATLAQVFRQEVPCGTRQSVS